MKNGGNKMVKVAVVGSINMDLVVEAEKLPNKGETVSGDNFFMSPGGKGANQGVAAARLGAEVYMFGSVGEDENGTSMCKNLQREGINISFINHVKEAPTGVAMIELCKDDNSIVVVPGANAYTDLDYLEQIKGELLNFDVVIFQMEIPIRGVEFLVDYLNKNNRISILNPAPAIILKKSVIDKVSYITPNEHEYEIILDTKESMEEALKKYPNKLIITNGGAGVKYYDGNDIIVVPSIRVKAIDTTGAGDTFSGAFAVNLAEGKNLYDSIRLANIAAGISVTKKGAQGGMPNKAAVTKYLQELNNL